ncbi:DUF6544 family protein [Senegalia massiliensis]|uniref:DUF6544 family protein n=1 Tax=Senegalia massiliensis TaxID=1720316 RepID=UPI0010317C7C|nr:DUF6544 family protein [Senegalia massiliensis]
MSKLTLGLIGIFILLILFISVSFTAKFLFKQHTNNEVKGFFNNIENHGEIIIKEDIKKLPKNVQLWLEYSGIVGKEKITSVRLKQKAYMRLEKDKSWMEVEAEQYFKTEEPGFVWNANIKMVPLIHISGRDKYNKGKGNMLIKPLSLFTIADSKGREIDQGSLLRYLAEMVWFPTASLNDYLTWEEIDKYNARVTMNYKGIKASGIFTFNDKNQIINFEAQRYGEFNGEYRLETWSIPIRNYKEFEGIKIPTKGDVTWKLNSGDFNWFNFEIIEVEYNKLIPY